MKVFIEELRVKLNQCAEGTAYTEFAYELNEALNELEELRRYRNDTRQLREEHTQLRNDFARLTEIKDNLIIAGNRMRNELTGRTETTSFKKWFKNLHPETIESVTLTFRKKESN